MAHVTELARRGMRWLGGTALLLGLASVGPAVVLMLAGDQGFSFTTTFLSDLGSSDDPWVRTFFNSGLLLLAPVRFALFLLVARIAGEARSRAWTVGLLVLTAAAVTLGGIGVASVPFSMNQSLHGLFAMVYYLGWIAHTIILTGVAWRRLSLDLVVANSIVAITGAAFVALVAMGYGMGAAREAPAVVAEWITFVALIAWVIAHTVTLGFRTEPVSARPRRGRPSGTGGTS